MDAEPSLSRSISSHLQGALAACRGVWSHAAKLTLDIALPTLCVARREPVEGEGVCADCWAKLSFIAPPFCPRLGIPFVYDPGPGHALDGGDRQPAGLHAGPRRRAL
jgi:Double zinc ribbon domain